ncbi:UNVERIFIED_CONTAM: hypothetical protein FKN15_002591 [Acipenser sinensis]
MVPFLAQEYPSKKDILDKANTTLKILKVDPLDNTLPVPHKQLDIGFATKQALDKASLSLQTSELRAKEFKKECLTFLAATSKKLLERSPLLYPAVRHMAALDPVLMVNEEKTAASKFENLLQQLLNAKWYTAAHCDKLLAEYKHFLSQMTQNS